MPVRITTPITLDQIATAAGLGANESMNAIAGSVVGSLLAGVYPPVSTRANHSMSEYLYSFGRVQQSDRLVHDSQFYYNGDFSRVGNGAAVAISGNGLVAVTINNNHQFHRFQRSSITSNDWQQIAAGRFLSASNGGNTNYWDRFSLALNSNGSILLVGLPYDLNGSGRVYIFDWNGVDSYESGASVTSSEFSIDNAVHPNLALGTSVGISNNNYVVIGLGGYNAGQGAVGVFTYDPASPFIDDAVLLPVSGTSTENSGRNYLGAGVSINSDGTIVAAGAPQYSVGGVRTGAAWVFVRSGTTWSQQARLVGSGGVGNQSQGRAVALDSLGTTLAIGGISDNIDVGATWVFVRSGTTWSQQGSKLVGTGYVGNSMQGRSMVIRNNTLVVGATNDDSYNGAAWVFVRSGTTWSQQGSKLVAGTSSLSEAFGASISITTDGSSIIVGSPWSDWPIYDSDGTTDQYNNRIGAAYVYNRSGSTWSQNGKLVGTWSLGVYGNAMVTSADGNRLAVASTDGSLRVYIRQSGSWVLKGVKFAMASGVFGPSVAAGYESFGSYNGYSHGIAASADLTTIAVGMPSYGTNVGAVWVFKWNPTDTNVKTAVTVERSALIGTGYTGTSRQGAALAMSADGNTLAVGGPFDSTNDYGNSMGSTWIFTRSGTTWSQQARLVGTNVTHATLLPLQGYAVALSADGNTLAIGGPYFTSDPNANTATGAAWIFTRSGTTWTQQARLVGTGSVAGSTFVRSILQGISVALSADGNTLAMGGPGDAGTGNLFNDLQLGAVWVFTRSGSTWTQQGSKLVGTGYDYQDGVGQGLKIVLSASGNMMAVVGPRDGYAWYATRFGDGAVWIFTRSGSTWTQQGDKISILLSGGRWSAVDTLELGRSIALNSSGTRLIVSGPGDFGGQGSIWTFE